MIKSYNLTNLLLTIVVLSISFTVVVAPSKARALSGNDFNPSRIIDDSIFYDANSLTSRQIQDFMNAKVPICDSQGIQAHGNTTRAAYGTSVGFPPPYTCLKDYRQDTTSKPYEEGLCNGYSTVNQSSAEIIYNVARSCGISPKVLLVLLQKEQALVTDDWPWSNEYRAATGYACPDTAPCDAQYYGFFNQVYSAARQYKYYAKNAVSFNYIAGRNNFIRYNPNSNCGGSTLFIQNQATAGLYNYTPYQPNASALSNLYGSGDSCSAYGNRNFWRLFNDWFGSTSDNIPISYSVRLVSPVTTTPANPASGQPITTTYTIQNFGTQTVTLQSTILQCRINKATNCDSPPSGQVQLAANEQKTISTTFTPSVGGQYGLTPYSLQDGVWYRYASASFNSITVNVPDLRITTPITTIPENPNAGQAVTVRYTIKNYGTIPVDLQTSLVQCRINGTTNCDSNYGGSVTLSPGQQLPVEYYLNPVAAGINSLTPYYQQGGVWYTYGAIDGAQATLPLSVPDVRITAAMSLSPLSTIPGQSTTLAYTIQNFASTPTTLEYSLVQCRLNTLVNCDTGNNAPITLASNESRTFTVSISTPKAGNYAFVPYFYQNNHWYQYKPNGSFGNFLRLDVPPYVANMQLTSDIVANPSQPIPGQPFSLTYTVKNSGDKPGIYQTSILQCRLNNAINCDPAYDSAVTINPGEQKIFTVNYASLKAGSYVFTPYYAQNDSFYKYAPATNGTNYLKLNIPAYVADLRLVSAVALSPSIPIAGQDMVASYTVKNFGEKPANIQTSILQCRLNKTTNCDPQYNVPQSIAPGDQYTYNATINTKSGTYSLTPYFMQNDTWLLYGGPYSGTNQINVP